MKQSSQILRGILKLARGRADGIAEFSETPNGLTASLAPLIAFPLVGAGLLAFNGDPKLAALSFLSRLCVVLALSVITHAFARAAGREAFWLRTATALNWSFWLTVPLLLVAAFAGALLVTFGVPELMAQYIMLGALTFYLLWYHWFTLRSGLRIGNLPAFGIMAVTNFAVALLSFGPDLLGQLFSHR